MPAVSVENILSLPKVVPHDLTTSIPRQVVSITNAPKAFEGEGFPVYRAFAGVNYKELDPFIHMDEMGEVQYAPGEPKGTPWHPHRGFETVTYLIDGTFEHQDSTGGGGTIANGATQWMTAGSGILHIEKPPESLVVMGGLFHGIQLWVNLPKEKKWSPPKYQDIGAPNVVLLSSYDGGSLLRLIAGNIGSHIGPGMTNTPINFMHASISPGAQLDLPWPKSYNGLVYVLSGKGKVGPSATPIKSAQLTVFGSGDFMTISADISQDSKSPNLEVIILGGQPIREPISWAGPFVMNTRAEVVQAYEDYRSGRLGNI